MTKTTTPTTIISLSISNSGSVFGGAHFLPYCFTSGASNPRNPGTTGTPEREARNIGTPEPRNIGTIGTT